MTIEQIQNEGYKIEVYKSGGFRDSKQLIIATKNKKKYVAWSFSELATAHFTRPIKFS